MVVAQETAQSLPTCDLARLLSHFLARYQNPITQSLVIAFLVVMLQELGNRPPQHRFAKEDHAVETLLLNRSVESLELRIEVGTLGR